MLWFWLLFGWQPTSPFGVPTVRGEVKAKIVSEASGMVVSRRHSDLLWLHNDSGTKAEVFAYDTKGKHLGTHYLADVSALDWEDMALGKGLEPGTFFLYVADMGNNRAHKGGPRPFVSIHRFLEPATPEGEHTISSIDTFEVVYPDGAHDVEAMLVDPIDESLYFFSKREARARIYRLPGEARPGATRHTLEYIGDLPHTLLTAADISEDGSRIMLKDYASVWYWEREGKEPLSLTFTREAMRVPTYLVEPQGETLALTPDGRSFYTLSEARDKKKVPLYYYPPIEP